jgi:hypothetical protein
VADGRAYFSCDTDVVVVDVATNQVVTRFKGVNRTDTCGMACFVLPDAILLDGAGGFWASAQIPATAKNVTRRYDIATGAVTGEVDGWLMGGGDGVMYLWTGPSGGGLGGELIGRSIRTGSQVAYEKVGEDFSPLSGDPSMGFGGTVHVVCGSLLATQVVDHNTVLDYQGWAANRAEPGELIDTMEYDGVCWGLFNDGTDYTSDGPYHIARFGPAGMDQRSPELPGPVEMWNGSLWLSRSFNAGSQWVFQRLDPKTWQLGGLPWSISAHCYYRIDVAGSLWCGGSMVTLDLMDIGMDGRTRILPKPVPSAPPLPSQSISPEPSPSVLPSPSVAASL